MHRTAIYLRVSKDGLKQLNQYYHIKKYIEYKNLGKFTIFRDKATGRNQDRPKWQKLMECVKTHQVDRVIVFKMDRVSRSLKDTLLILEHLNAYNVNLISINENFDPSTPMGKAFVSMIATFAELESNTISERTKANYARLKDKHKQDLKWGRRKETNTEKVKELYSMGYSMRHIATLLNCSATTISRHLCGKTR